MGGSESKKAEVVKYETLFTSGEKEELKRVFDSISCSCNGSAVKTAFGLKCLQDYVGNRLSEKITTRLHQEMCSVLGTDEKHSIVTMEMFCASMALLLKGTAEEQSAIIHHLATENRESVTAQEMYEFVSDIIHYIEDAMKSTIAAKNWHLVTTAESNNRFARYLLRDLFWRDEASSFDLPEKSYTEEDIDVWLSSRPYFSQVLTVVFRYALKFQQDQIEEGASSASIDSTAIYQEAAVFPVCQDVNFMWSKLNSILDIPSVLFLNHHLPQKLKSEWRLLFSTRLHGESFATFFQDISDKGPNIIIVKDTDGHVFGGFASETWLSQANFYGNSSCFLFSLSPFMDVYMSTGSNANYMYVNQKQQTLPNGLGMGGQFNYFGLWLDANFGTGHSKAEPKCRTYDSPQLSKESNFKIDVLEVWRVGPPPPKPDEEEEGRPSILDADPEATAILELIGKERKSEGLRDKDPTADIPEVKDLPPM
ncbi:MTOR-associated protein MEAK7-like isoform X2 [Ptychodera flava]|uniref:MTOR-associated protein MEAK7-like isoform X2 n=1 Tax=Ptychodera flava TaxID=63121 RepID=UPI00396A9F60